MIAPGTRVAVISDDPADVHKSPAELGLIAPVAEACAALATQVSQRESTVAEPMRRPSAPAPPAAGEPLTAGHVLAALAERLPPEAVVVEETPSSQPELYQRIPIRTPLGFVAAGNGGLGFGLSGSIGLRLGFPERPVVAVLGDGSAMYAIQGLWSAARYGIGALFVVMGNGRYAIMDALAQSRGGAGPWPSFDAVDVAGMARCLGCDAVRIETHEELAATLDDVVPGLAGRAAPLLVEVAVA
jgi:benzoylformate decarboxylase